MASTWTDALMATDPNKLAKQQPVYDQLPAVGTQTVGQDPLSWALKSQKSPDVSTFMKDYGVGGVNAGTTASNPWLGWITKTLGTMKNLNSRKPAQLSSVLQNQWDMQTKRLGQAPVARQGVLQQKFGLPTGGVTPWSGQGWNPTQQPSTTPQPPRQCLGDTTPREIDYKLGMCPVDQRQCLGYMKPQEPMCTTNLVGPGGCNMAGYNGQPPCSGQGPNGPLLPPQPPVDCSGYTGPSPGCPINYTPQPGCNGGQYSMPTPTPQPGPGPGCMGYGWSPPTPTCTWDRYGITGPTMAPPRSCLGDQYQQLSYQGQPPYSR